MHRVNIPAQYQLNSDFKTTTYIYIYKYIYLLYNEMVFFVISAYCIYVFYFISHMSQIYQGLLMFCLFKGSKLLKELKKLDDKALLVEVQLLESKIYHSLKNIPRSRYNVQVYAFNNFVQICYSSWILSYSTIWYCNCVMCHTN